MKEIWLTIDLFQVSIGDETVLATRNPRYEGTQGTRERRKIILKHIFDYMTLNDVKILYGFYSTLCSGLAKFGRGGGHVSGRFHKLLPTTFLRISQDLDQP